MQYAHCVACATATATSCFVRSGSAPGANTLRLNARNASAGPGARRRRSSAISGVACGRGVSSGGVEGTAGPRSPVAGIDGMP